MFFFAGDRYFNNKMQRIIKMKGYIYFIFLDEDVQKGIDMSKRTPS